MLRRQAELLGITLPALLSMRSLYDKNKAVVVFPMYDALQQPIGCRFRRSDGRKWSLKGGREGLFLGANFTPKKPVFVCEGPTDAAALYVADILNVIGRPNCAGGSAYISAVLAGHSCTPVIILSDPDECGLDGAARLAAELRNPSIVLAGPTDVREFVSDTDLPSKARYAILEGLSNDDAPIWRPVYRNMPGLHFQFKG